MTIIEPSPQVVSPRYDLDAAARAELFTDAVSHLGELIVPDITNVLVINGTHPLSNYVRGVEMDQLPIVPENIGDAEASSRFLLVLQDNEEGVAQDAAAHVFRINQLLDGPSNRMSGLPTFDDAVIEGKVTEQELIDYYDVESLPELGQIYINVEANIAVDGVRRSLKKPYSGLGYRAIFELVREGGLRGVVAAQNKAAMDSMAHIGLRHHPLVGNPKIHFMYPTQDPGKTGDEPLFPLTIESTPWSKLQDGSAENNFKTFTDPEYAASVSRIAGLVASKPINVINIR